MRRENQGSYTPRLPAAPLALPTLLRRAVRAFKGFPLNSSSLPRPPLHSPSVNMMQGQNDSRDAGNTSAVRGNKSAPSESCTSPFPIHGARSASELPTTAYAYFHCYSFRLQLCIYHDRNSTDCILAAGPKGNGWDMGTPGHLGKGQPPFAAAVRPPLYPTLPFHKHKGAKPCQKSPTKLPPTSLQLCKAKRSISILLALDKRKRKTRNRNKMT